MEQKTEVLKGFKREFQRLLQSFLQKAYRGHLRFCVERVTGIEPAWPAWKAREPEPHLGRSAWSQAYVVPFVCLKSVPWWPDEGPALAGRAVILL
jgi:hypothetical protein